jgi:hypothetical protein
VALLLMKKADWYLPLMAGSSRESAYLIELERDSGKVAFGRYNVLTDRESVMQLLDSTKE